MWTAIKAWIGARAIGITSVVERRLGVVLGVLGIAMLAMAAVFLMLNRAEEALVSDNTTASLRNLFLVLVAIIGVPLAIWRSAVAKQQANASDRQAETAERRLKNELYEKGAAMLGNTVPSVRLGGIYSLKGLANQNPDEYQDQVMDLLCAFVRDPPDERAKTPGKGGEDSSNTSAGIVRGTLRDDVQTAVNIIAKKRDAPEQDRHWGKQRPLDLRGARLEAIEAVGRDLRGAILHGANLNGAQLANANLEGAQMATGSMKEARASGANFSRAALTRLDMTRIDGNGADFSECRISGLEISGALAGDAKFSKSQISGSDFRGAMLQRAKLDHCHLTSTDFSGADFWRADLSGAKFGKAVRVSVGAEGSTRKRLFCKLTQGQIDKALAHPNNPPTFDPAMLDSETGERLVWRGGCISEDQYSLLHALQQVVKVGSAEWNQGHYFEWQDMEVRFVPGIMERLGGRELGRTGRRASDALESSEPAGCTRITFVAKNGSEVDSCGVTRWNDESRIWMLCVYQEEGEATKSHSASRFFEKNGPDTEMGCERLLNEVDWAANPIVETLPGSDDRFPRPRR